MTIEEAILEKVRALSPEKQREVLDFADFLRRKYAIGPEPLSDAGRAVAREGEAAVRSGDFTALEDLKSELASARDRKP